MLLQTAACCLEDERLALDIDTEQDVRLAVERFGIAAES